VNAFTYAERFQRHNAAFDQSMSEPTHHTRTTIMTTLFHALDAGTNAKRFTIGPYARAIACVMMIIGTVTIAAFALSRAHFAPSGYHFGDNAADAQAAREAAAKVLCGKFCKN
jgi:hypothetical protein